MSTTDLVLLTHEYPFGVESETFLEAELPILAERFDRILILPHMTRPTVRAVPPNAEVVPMGWTVAPSRSERLLALRSLEAGRVLRWSVGAPADLWRHARAPRLYVDVLGRNILKYRELGPFIRERGLSDAVFYDYWFENSTIALALLRRSGAIRTAVARAHNFEVFGVEYGSNPPPFRQAKAVGLDAIMPTSRAAEAHLAAHTPAARGKLQVHRLGVPDPGVLPPRAEPEAPALIVTCAMLTVKKRVHLVPETLASLDVPFRWVHIGDGPERQRVVDAAERFLDPGTWELVGQLTNPEVHEFYCTHPVRVVLSLSESEGLPVSMMEAQSYGVPIVACDVGGVSEIVDQRTGVLLNAHASVDELARGLEPALDPHRFDQEEIRAQWRERYDAQTNYTRFADALLALAKREGSSDRVKSR